jgi:hypothetical protein
MFSTYCTAREDKVIAIAIAYGTLSGGSAHAIDMLGFIMLRRRPYTSFRKNAFLLGFHIL